MSGIRFFRLWPREKLNLLKTTVFVGFSELPRRRHDVGKAIAKQSADGAKPEQQC